MKTGLFFTHFRNNYQWPGDCSFSAKPGAHKVLALISFILLLCLTPGVIAADSAPDKSRLLTAVVLNDFPPLYSRSKEGKPIGFAIDILERVTRDSDLTIRYLAVENWSEAMQAIRTGKADIIPGIGISPVRSAEFLFTKQVETIPVSLFVRASNQAINGLETLSGNKIGVIGESAAETRLKTLQINTLVSFPNIESALFQLMSGAIDVFVFPEPVLKQKMRMIDIGPDRIKVVGKPLMELKRGFLLRKTDQDLAELLNSAIHAYTQSSEYLTNYQKWYGQPAPYWTVKRISWSMAIALILIAAGLLNWRFYSINRLNQRLQESETRLTTLINSMPDLVWLKTPEGIYQFCNSRFELFFGAKEPEIVGKTDYDFVDKELADFFREKDKAAILANAPSKNEEQVIFANDGHQELLETIKTPIVLPSGKTIGVLGVGRDITERRKLEHLDQVRHQLNELLYQGDQSLLMQTALDTAEKITDSQIGFFHFVEPDQETISLQVWSTRTLKEMCSAKGDGLHYPISEAGVWVDCIYKQQTVIHNDYDALPDKKGLPEGHVRLVRELTIPLKNADKIVAVIGVGNKAENYTHKDVELVTQIAEIALDYLQRIQAKQQVEFMAYYDILTGLPNRALLHDRFHHDIAHTQRAKKLLAVCYLDLDGFKPVNDRYGHDIGDELLKIIAARLGKDLRDGDTLARIGGDEFVMLLTDLSTMYQCEEIIQRILQSINNPIEIEKYRIHISTSIGITIFPTDNGDLDTLLRHADQAMYQAKAAGKAKFRFYNPIQDLNLRTQRKMLLEFDNALHNNQLILHYQPKVDLRNGQVIGVEALVRWQHPQEGLLYPGRFLPVIEGTPQEIALDEWVVKSALKQHMSWYKAGLELTMSVNISPRHMQLKGFVDFMSSTLSAYPQQIANSLELEILETTAIGDMSRVASIMQACSALGIHFSLDDFGTGYSSLTYFYRLPIDILKIDQNFVKDMLDDTSDLDIVEGVLHLAKTLHRPVIAEGVESIELGIMLLQLGCHYAQGYGIAAPMPAERLPEWLNQWHDNSVWHQLPKEVTGTAENFDLNVAIVSIKHWINKINAYVNQEPEASLPMMSDQNCQFARWYKGIGRIRYGDRPVYAFLSPKHTRLHELGDSVVKHLSDGQRDKVDLKLKELDAIATELIDLIRKLAS